MDRSWWTCGLASAFIRFNTSKFFCMGSKA